MTKRAIGRVWRKGERVHARIQVGGVRVQSTHATERDAWAWVYAQRELAADAPTKAPKTLLDVGKAWFDAREKAKRVRHVKQERSVWRAHVETWQGAHRPLRSLTRRHVHDFVGELGAAKSISRQTVKHVLRLIRQVVAHAHDIGVIGADPIASLRVPREAHVSGEHAWTWLTVEEIAAVLGACSSLEQRAAVAVAVYVGLRKSEIWQLRWSEVKLDGDAPELHVRGMLKSETSERTVPLLPPAVAALKAWKATQDAAQKASDKPAPIRPLCFPSASGGVRRSDDDMGWADKRWRGPDGEMRVTVGVPSRAGITRRVRFHDLRHTCASHLVQGSWGMVLSLEEVRQWLGHSSIGVTQRYSHLSPRGLRAKALAMREAMTAAEAEKGRERWD